VHRHPEQALADGLVQVLDVDASLEQQRGDLRDEASVVLADDGYLREVARHVAHLVALPAVIAPESDSVSQSLRVSPTASGRYSVIADIDKMAIISSD